MEMSTDEATKVAASYYDRFNAGDLDGVVALFAEDYVGHRGLGSGGGGQETVRAHLGIWYEALPDAKLEVVRTVSDGEWVATFNVIRGTHTGDFLGLTASGSTIELSSTDVFRVQEGRITEGWTVCDLGSFFIAAGAVPALAG
jgi:steroid delta-isomerase-like uncharacterized protein